MKIAVLSGKGGTGKTLVSVNLAYVGANSYTDCDVEAPNGYLYFEQNKIDVLNVNVKKPVFDNDKCVGCRKCVEFCKFNALAFVNKKVKLFDDICHSCEGCKIVCDYDAISMTDNSIGNIEKGMFENIIIQSGILNIGSPSGSPIIKELMKSIPNEGIHIIDGPPGTACTSMETIRESDYCVVVAEPTSFGYSNYLMIEELLHELKTEFGVVINKWIDDESSIMKHLEDNSIDLLGIIPFDKDIVNINSNSGIIAKESKEYNEVFKNILDTILEKVKNETTISS
jgi:MinD superfamily P-loop ATPase